MLELRIEAEEAIGPDNVELLTYRHEFDIRNAILKRELRCRRDRFAPRGPAATTSVSA